MAGDLEAQARRFANETSDLLNGTVCRGVRISTLRTPRGDVIMGPGIKKTRPDPAPIPITTGSKARVFLYLIHSYCLDPEGEFLTMASSTLSLTATPDASDGTSSSASTSSVSRRTDSGMPSPCTENAPMGAITFPAVGSRVAGRARWAQSSSRRQAFGRRWRI